MTTSAQYDCGCERSRFCARAALLLFLSAAAAFGAPLSAQTPSPVPRVTPQQSTTTQLIQAVHAVNERVVWAAGHGGVVLRTTNGGTTWEQRPTPAGDSIEFRDVHATSAFTAWVMSAGNGAASRIYHTLDGGATWTRQFLNSDSTAFYDCFAFLDNKTAVAYSDVSNDRTLILRTDNAGQSWALLPPSVVPAPLPREGAFASSGQCVVAADNTTAYIAAGAPGSRLMRSTDAGKSWSVNATPFVHNTTSGMTGLAFTDALHGMAVAADIGKLRGDTSSAVVGVTADGGRTWTMRPRPPLPGALSGAAWVRGAGREVAVVVGFGGAFTTPDAGLTWHTLNDQIFTGVSAFGKTAWIAGGSGRIVRLDW